MKCIHCNAETDEGRVYQTSDAWLKQKKKRSPAQRIKKQGFICNESVIQLADAQSKRALNTQGRVLGLILALVVVGFISDKSAPYHKLLVVVVVAGVFIGVMMAFQAYNLWRNRQVYARLLAQKDVSKTRSYVENVLNFERSITAQTVINRFLDTSPLAESVPAVETPPAD